MVIVSDTSFLFSLYGNDAHSHRAVGYIENQYCPIHLNRLTIFELENAIRFAEFRKAIPAGSSEEYCGRVRSAISRGRLMMQITNLADVFHEAQRLSQQRTLQGGHRGFDILHAANALVMKATHFLTFDHNQKQLAEAEGLIVPNI